LQTDEIIALFKKHKGYLSSAQLQKYKVHTLFIKNLIEQKAIERVRRGLYRLPPEQLCEDEIFTHDYFDAVQAVPNGIFCLRTALSFYNLTTYNPSELDMAIPPTNRTANILTTALRFYRFREPFYSSHISTLKTSLFPVKMYERERSVCDALRMRHMIGEDIAMEALNNYMKQSQKDITKLLARAKFCRVKHIVEPAVKAMTGF